MEQPYETKRANPTESSTRAKNAILPAVGNVFGLVLLLLSLPFILTAKAKFPVIGLIAGILMMFLGSSPFYAGGVLPVGLVIVSIGLILTGLLCVLGFFASFKPELLEGRHGNRAKD